ncbi:peptide chain release factor N(5)-glutamine methyltransferase [Hymenobacter jejuensis]|uniref:peptide chain release factor N(5)-glutamine methyltransferase n=1 Tax=Hymenobacter jejuensis TaxID=2502781 RepID=A0A5B7ZZR4_9BACT|nr:peptide chain release factor N(5)-glutamine methyltransferase [Hymenobacter jejuensis]QDA59973.1 peptide chain release factor N(5)-glutamine methyltransferase [Hymenobacter jejuensis]
MNATIRQAALDLATALEAIYPASEAQAIAGLVIEHLLHLTPLQRRMQANDPLPPEVLQEWPALQARLLRHEPVQYVLGVAHFADMELEVTPATLIPRPETEELVQLIIHENQQTRGLSLLDIGTGSGCIPLALSRALHPHRAVAVDISEAALAVARRNAERYRCEIEFQQLDILADTPKGIAAGSLDVVVSNPPYVLESERGTMRSNVLDYEPATALFVPNDDPLLFYRRIADVSQQLLRSGGGLYFEINEQYAAALAALLTNLGYAKVQAQADLFGKDRMMRATKP